MCVGHPLVHVCFAHQIRFIVDYNKRWSISQLGVKSFWIKCAVASSCYHRLAQCRNREGLAAIAIPGDNEGVLGGQRERERSVSSLSLSGFFADITHINRMVRNLPSPVRIERGTEFFFPLNSHDCVVSVQHRKLRGRGWVVWVFKQQSFHNLSLWSLLPCDSLDKAKSTDSTRRSYLKHQKTWCEDNTGQTHLLSSQITEWVWLWLRWRND